MARPLFVALLTAAALTTTDSGHNVMLYQPQLVTDEIAAIVEQVRAG